MKLDEQNCVPCKGGVPPLTPDESAKLLGELAPGWNVIGNHHLHKPFKFKNFAEALAYVNRVGAIAESQNHHPDILLAWGKVEITIWTHKIDGLTQSDFIFAAKCDAALQAGC